MIVLEVAPASAGGPTAKIEKKILVEFWQDPEILEGPLLADLGHWSFAFGQLRSVFFSDTGCGDTRHDHMVFSGDFVAKIDPNFKHLLGIIWVARSKLQKYIDMMESLPPMKCVQKCAGVQACPIQSRTMQTRAAHGRPVRG